MRTLCDGPRVIGSLQRKGELSALPFFQNSRNRDNCSHRGRSVVGHGKGGSHGGAICLPSRIQFLLSQGRRRVFHHGSHHGCCQHLHAAAPHAGGQLFLRHHEGLYELIFTGSVHLKSLLFCCMILYSIHCVLGERRKASTPPCRRLSRPQKV